MSKIDQIHLRAVMLCMSKMGKEHTHTFLLITFLIFNQFSIPKKFGKLRLRALHITVYIKACQRCQRWEKNIHNFLNIEWIFNLKCMLKDVEDVEG